MLELALKIPVANLTIYGDSELIVKQLCMDYSVKKTKLISYHKRVENLTVLEEVKILHVCRVTN